MGKRKIGAGISLILFACFTFTLTACGILDSLKQPAHPVNYYTLEYAVPEISVPTPLPVILRVEKFQISPAYNTNNIIYREAPFGLDPYTYHKWRVNPADLVTYFLTRDLNEASLFRSVVTLKSRLMATHILEGIVDDFYEQEEEDTWKAVLTIRITLIKNNEPDISKQILFHKKYSQRTTLCQNNPQALAEAMSQNMASISNRIARDIYSHVSESVEVK